MPEAACEGAGLVTRRIVHQRMTVCASPNYLAAHGTPRSIPDLEQHQAVIYSRSGRGRAWRFPQEGRASFEITPKNRLRILPRAELEVFEGHLASLRHEPASSFCCSDAMSTACRPLE
jgi:DNA-binding transcriptional LysR family regulator